jgi:hypothetical protein
MHKKTALSAKVQFPVFTVLPNLRKQISVICLLSILKISQPHGFRFIFVTLCDAKPSLYRNVDAKGERSIAATPL